VLLAIRVNDTKIALKSGFEKYLRVEKDGVIRGTADAVGSMEQWEPIFEVKRKRNLFMYYVVTSNIIWAFDQKIMNLKKKLLI
jgi:hypothetical protein